MRSMALAGLALLVAALTACGGSGPPTSRPAGGVAAKGAVAGGSREAGGPGAPAAAEGPLGALGRAVEAAARAAIDERKVPGCVVAIGRREGVLFEAAYGKRALEPAAEDMTVDTVFDLASLTKPVATAASVVVLADRGRVDLDAPASRYVPEFGARGKAGVTVRQLLTHVGGVAVETPMADYELGEREALRRALGAAPAYAPGARFVYSDVGYLALGELVARASGKGLAAFARSEVFEPLGMVDTGFQPPPEALARVAPTERVEGRVLRGEVHDPRARRMGGVAGHAGLFGTARDLARFARALLGGGSLEGARVWSPRAQRAFVAPHDVPDGVRALGWDVQTAYSKNRPAGASRRAFGHGGYTGVSMWVDPALDLFVIVLSNRVHPDGAGSSNELAARVGGAAVEALGGGARAGEGPCATPARFGVDALAGRGFEGLEGARVGLLTNGAARTRDGERTVDRLARAGGVELVRIFSPEHGLRADQDGSVASGVDEATGLPVVSLYGGRLDPPPGSLDDLDALAVDLPDVGARFYTYASTLHRAMRAAARQGVRVVVLDRPNPLGGHRVAGPVFSGPRASFVNHHPLPVEHGMTLGELAEMMAADEHLALDLRVVLAPGWRRGTLFAETGLPWSAPSPNLRTPDEVLLYPGVALVEGANVSVGRGTDTPFELVGAPWVDGARLARALEAERLAGVSFEPATFSPKADPYRGIPCHGVRVRLDDPARFEPVRAGLALARALATLYPIDFRAEKMADLIGDAAVLAALRAGRPVDEIMRSYAPGLDAFARKRQKYLLYPEGACPPR
ncbi:MAG TPA: serine hydrolase [Polyangiaceae bacterium]|nr:serine hydrolase [Polyangiaceae bacterium]